MAKRFFEREEFGIEQFVSMFRLVYDLYYNSPAEQTDEYTMMCRGADLVQDDENKPLLKAYYDHVGDILTSDRELAAFAVTYDVYKGRFAT